MLGHIMCFSYPMMRVTPSFKSLPGTSYVKARFNPLDDLPNPKAFENAGETVFFRDLRMKIQNR